jgi:hypothetical protein
MNYPTLRQTRNIARRAQIYCTNNGGINGLIKLLYSQNQNIGFDWEIICALEPFNMSHHDKNVNNIIKNLFATENSIRLTNIMQSFNWLNQLL